jgi:signal transduction histidine kinase
VARKLTVALAITGVVLFAGYGVFQAWEERATLERTALAETTVLARSLQVATENAMRDGQFADVRESLGVLEAQNAGIDLLVYDATGKLRAHSAEQDSVLPEEQRLLSEIRAGDGPQSVFLRDPGSPRLAVVAPLLGENGERLGALLVRRPLRDVEEDLRKTGLGLALAVVLFAAASVLVGQLAGHYLVSRPLRQVVQVLRRMREGDISPVAAPSIPDDLGQLTAELDSTLAELRALRERLEAEQTRARAFEERIQEADKLIAIGQVAAGLAHEIGSPLQVLLGRARALEARELPFERVRAVAKVMAEQAEIIVKRMEQLLGYVRRRPPRRAPEDLGLVVNAVVQLLELEAKRRGASIEVRVPEQPVVVWGDASELQQVVFNLVRNALQAGSRGNKVAVTVNRQQIDPDVGPSASLEVADLGRGIPPEEVPRIFEPFFTTRAHEGGTGLGLAVVKTIVEAHRGAIAVDSTPGAGTRIRVLLPAGEQERP